MAGRWICADAAHLEERRRDDRAGVAAETRASVFALCWRRAETRWRSRAFPDALGGGLGHLDDFGTRE